MGDSKVGYGEVIARMAAAIQDPPRVYRPCVCGCARKVHMRGAHICTKCPTCKRYSEAEKKP